ncbi:FadR/GntR family transcriptional regulator [Nocardia sp. NPDC050406]|uniref:FadR/GntR family transcriptional regulator n=1 Tax=Nocardia sp. NPDC050406 TaxID=3364318 RepID=UPI0037B07B43
MDELAQPIRNPPLSQQVADTLREKITRGEWPIGTRIPAEPELISALGVGRSTVREAVRALVQVRMLEPRPGDGTYVRSDSALEFPLVERVSRARPREALEVRAMLEQRVARLAAIRATESDIERFRAQLAGLEPGCLDAEHLADFLPAALALFYAIAETADNPLLGELYRFVLDTPTTGVPTDIDWSAAAGRRWIAGMGALIDAIASGDPDRAEHAARDYSTAWLSLIPSSERPAL